MKCYEYEGKKIFKDYNICVPKGQLVKNEKKAVDFFKELSTPCVLKAQVLSGKRGKVGGIKFVDNLIELKNNYEKVKNMKIYGEKVKNILLEEKLNIKREFYLGITIDPSVKGPVIIFSSEGGMDIEKIAEKYPGEIIQYNLYGDMKKYNFYDMLSSFNFDNKLMLRLGDVMNKLTNLFFEVDASTVEINPLVLNEKDLLIAADSKLVIDNSALFRQQALNLEKKSENISPFTKRAKEAGLSYVPLEKKGNVGSIAGGAGLAMATMDTIRYCGGRPANFLDVGGGVSEGKMSEALKIVASRKNVRGIIINVFGGINNCEFMAKGIEKAIEEDKIEKEIVVKMRGHFQERGWKILEKLNIPIIKHGTTEEAVELLMRNLEGGQSNNVSSS